MSASKSRHPLPKQDEAVLRIEELPTVKELFAACDRDALKKVIIEDFVCRGSCVSDEGYESMCQRIDSTLDCMASLQTKRRAQREWVIAPWEAYQLKLENDLIAWRLNPVMFPLVKGKYLKRMIRAIDGGATTYKEAKKVEKRLAALSADACCGFGSVSDLEMLEGRGYALDPWEETLSCKVWLDAGWCCRDRYVVLAGIFWEMTFFGFEYDQMISRAFHEKAKRAAGCAQKKAPASLGGSKNAAFPVHPDSHGLRIKDLYREESRMDLTKRVAVLNCNAQLSFYRRMLDLVRCLERG